MFQPGNLFWFFRTLVTVAAKTMDECYFFFCRRTRTAAARISKEKRNGRTVPVRTGNGGSARAAALQRRARFNDFQIRNSARG